MSTPKKGGRRKKAKVLCDMDGVLANFAKRAVEECNKRHGTSYDLANWTKFDVSDAFGEDAWKLMEVISNEPGFFYSLEPYPNAKEAISKTLEIADIHILSSPMKIEVKPGVRGVNPHCCFDKVRWIHDHFPDLADKVGLFSKKELVRADMLVDDALFNILNWSKAHPEGIGFLVDRPWNKAKWLSKNIIRANLEDLPSVVQERFGKAER